MELRRAQFRNMHSKCRCSCVLQFTRHHRVSSVLHRPQSQMIHCIVLYLDSLSTMDRVPGKLDELLQLQSPTRGKFKTEGLARLFKPLVIPSREPGGARVNGVRYLHPSAAGASRQTNYLPRDTQA